MNAVERSDVLANGPEGRQASGHLQRAAQGHGDTGRLTERRNRTLRKELLSKEGQNGEF